MSSSYILDIDPLSDIWFANIFSHSIGCLYFLLIVSFTALLVWCSLTCLFLILLLVLFISRKSLQRSMSRRFFPMFRPRSFTDSGLMFKSLIQIFMNNHSCCMSANLCFSYLFLASSIHLSFARLGGMKPKRALHAVPPRGWKRWLLTLPFLSWWEKLFVPGKLLGTEECWLGDRTMQAKWSCLPSPLCDYYSFFHCAAKTS